MLARCDHALHAALARQRRNGETAQVVKFGTRAERQLIQIVSSGEEIAATAAARAIGDIHAGEARNWKRANQTLIGALRDERWRVREAAAQALGQSARTEAKEPLFGLLEAIPRPA